jgi:hypothetical protein
MTDLTAVLHRHQAIVCEPNEPEDNGEGCSVSKQVKRKPGQTRVYVAGLARIPFLFKFEAFNNALELDFHLNT